MEELDALRDRLADAIERGLTMDSDGDYNFDVETSVEAVLDVLEEMHMLIFIDEN